MRSRSTLWLVCGALGCAPDKPASTPPALASDSAALQETPRTIVSNDEAIGVDELCARADRALEQARYAEALADYERVLSVDPHGPFVARAAFGAGTAHDLLGHHAQALAHYQRVASEFPGAAEAQSAKVRSVRLLVHLERYAEAGEGARQLLATVGEARLKPLESIAVFGAIALDHSQRGDDQGAMHYVGKGRNVIDAHGLEAGGTIPRDMAALAFALGEVRRQRAERITFVPVPPDFVQKLEERCQLLLDAQSAYSDAMRAEDAHWSAMAGYRVGELYERLHTDVMLVPPPAAADTEARRQLFEGAMRLRYSILLSKAQTMMKHTLAMVERTGEQTPWAARARSSETQIEQALAREQAAIARLPYTREQLQEALDDLGERAEEKPSIRAKTP